MKLFMLKQNEKGGYDTYSACVVCAGNEEEAKKIHPSKWAEDEWWLIDDGLRSYSSWATKLENVTAIYLGEADEDIEKGIILSSFHAG